MATNIPPASSRKRKATRNSSPSTPNSVPMHPSPRSVPTGSGSEISARSNPDKRREEQAGQKGPAETDAALAADDADQHRKKTARHQAEKEREQRHIRFD